MPRNRRSKDDSKNSSFTNIIAESLAREVPQIVPVPSSGTSVNNLNLLHMNEDGVSFVDQISSLNELMTNISFVESQYVESAKFYPNLKASLSSLEVIRNELRPKLSSSNVNDNDILTIENIVKELSNISAVVLEMSNFFGDRNSTTSVSSLTKIENEATSSTEERRNLPIYPIFVSLRGAFHDEVLRFSDQICLLLAGGVLISNSDIIIQGRYESNPDQLYINNTSLAQNSGMNKKEGESSELSKSESPSDTFSISLAPWWNDFSFKVLSQLDILSTLDTPHAPSVASVFLFSISEKFAILAEKVLGVFLRCSLRAVNSNSITPIEFNKNFGLSVEGAGSSFVSIEIVDGKGSQNPMNELMREISRFLEHALENRVSLRHQVLRLAWLGLEYAESNNSTPSEVVNRKMSLRGILRRVSTAVTRTSSTPSRLPRFEAAEALVKLLDDLHPITEWVPSDGDFVGLISSAVETPEHQTPQELGIRVAESWAGAVTARVLTRARELMANLFPDPVVVCFSSETKVSPSPDVGNILECEALCGSEGRKQPGGVPVDFEEVARDLHFLRRARISRASLLMVNEILLPLHALLQSSLHMPFVQAVKNAVGLYLSLLPIPSSVLASISQESGSSGGSKGAQPLLGQYGAGQEEYPAPLLLLVHNDCLVLHHSIRAMLSHSRSCGYSVASSSLLANRLASKGSFSSPNSISNTVPGEVWKLRWEQCQMELASPRLLLALQRSAEGAFVRCVRTEVTSGAIGSGFAAGSTDPEQFEPKIFPSSLSSPRELLAALRAPSRFESAWLAACTALMGFNIALSSVPLEINRGASVSKKPIFEVFGKDLSTLAAAAMCAPSVSPNQSLSSPRSNLKSTSELGDSKRPTSGIGAASECAIFVPSLLLLPSLPRAAAAEAHALALRSQWGGLLSPALRARACATVADARVAEWLQLIINSASAGPIDTSLRLLMARGLLSALLCVVQIAWNEEEEAPLTEVDSQPPTVRTCARLVLDGRSFAFTAQTTPAAGSGQLIGACVSGSAQEAPSLSCIRIAEITDTADDALGAPSQCFLSPLLLEGLETHLQQYFSGSLERADSTEAEICLDHDVWPAMCLPVPAQKAAAAAGRLWRRGVCVLRLLCEGVKQIEALLQSQRFVLGGGVSRDEVSAILSARFASNRPVFKSLSHLI